MSSITHWSLKDMIIHLNTLRPRQNGRHFADDIFKCIFLNENVWIPIEIALKFVPKESINNNSSLFQIMAWRRPGDKPLSEPMMVGSLTHKCVTRPQWAKWEIFELMLRIRFSLAAHYFQLNATELAWWKVTIGPCNGLLPSDNKPVPDTMLNYIYVTIWRH